MSEVNNISSKMELGNHLRKVLRLAKGSRHDEKLYEKAKKHLFQVDAEHMANIAKKYATDPEKIKRKLHPIFNKLIENDHILMVEENKLMEVFTKIVVELGREEFDDLKYLEKIFSSWEYVVHHRGALYTHGIIHDLQHEYVDFEKEIHEIIKKDFVDDRRLKNMKSPRVGFMTKLKSEKSLERQIIRLSKKGFKEEKTKEIIKNELERQLKQGSTELSFPYMFIKYLKEEGHLEMIFKKIEQDVKREIYEILLDRKKLVEHLNPVFRIVAQYKEYAKEINKEYNDLLDSNNKFSQELHAFITKDAMDQKVIHAEDQHVDDEMHHLIADLEHTARVNLAGHNSQKPGN